MSELSFLSPPSVLARGGGDLRLLETPTGR